MKMDINEVWTGDHNSLFLSFCSDNQEHACGVLEAGTHKYQAPRDTRIRVLVGYLFDSRDRQVRGDPNLMEELPIVKAGDKLVVTTHQTTAILLTFT